ncbi:thymic stromal cotransporter homolog isoform X1 [Apis laboriosa]|uniref:thymic stromal cotransporter homolog isoform X1 n=2 Tax=Apis laboriosa TaxID=183418 RepID=UPI001CC61C5B|nr:thymic stromal cotransporter homolog isoform X1 [Apis laboriosa]XP_043796780.1 thymic stromal cotransporter homolog isoform X1 [Apis laboriosa]XP_043796781.1 thymic stromal cotransporter homolog isoform X1 [Apis laboriosa]XP_043796782.1 thymic stromal cotransporter homolog isoform X1 [Apis laboriosa]XP_043796784.1 thymic stromal cotransporter homolog isoform X1 [Apis laboriosa]XP_043796785.1 thymic stromal cotransporter homolog isoform X1 [Apis laboriosa]
MENELRLNENESDKKWKKFFEWIKNVSVEPTMWLFMMAFMITSVVEQAFFVYKSCRVDHGYSEKICSNLNDNETIKTAVQLTVSNFHQWNNIAGHVVPIILAFFYGNWSDRRGRKLPLIMGLLGKFIYSFMIVINSMMDTWNLNTVVYFATLPMGMLGGDVVIFGSCFAYISDISSIQQRTLRITILDVIYLSTMPTGVALGSYIYTNVVNKSYTIMFIINASLLFLAILYSLIKLKWQTLPQQQVLMGTNLLTDFFDKKHIIATIKTVIKTRPNHGKLHLLFLLIIMMLYVFQRDEKPMSFLYTQLKFKWDVNTYSNFRTFQSSTFVLAMLIGVPIMSKLMKIRDTIIVTIGAIAHASGRIIFALAKIPELFYVGAGVAALGPIVAPVLRSMTSKLVTIEERGKIFAILSVCDNAVPLFSSILYSQLYNATINSAPSSIYWLTFITQIFVLFLILIIHFSIKNRSDQYVDDVDDEINN